MRGERTMRRRACWIVILLGSLVPLTPVGPDLARGQDASAPRPDHEARVLFRRVADAYKALDSYSDEGQFVVAMTLGDRPRREARPLRLTFRRPNKIDLDAGSVRLISDGKTLTTLVRPLKKYTTAPAPATIGIDTFREGPTGPLLFGGPDRRADLRPAQPAHGYQSRRSCSTRWAGTSDRVEADADPDRPPGRAGLAPPRRPGDPTALGHRSEDRPVSGHGRPARRPRSSNSAGRPAPSRRGSPPIARSPSSPPRGSPRPRT